MSTLRFITVGLGPVGRTLTTELKANGHKPVCLVGRAQTRDRGFAGKIRAPLLYELPKDIKNIDFILLTLQTSRLADYSRELAGRPLPWRELTFLHTSGSLGAKPLAPLARRGAGVAAVHPYQTFPKKAAQVHLQGITFGITGNRKGTVMAKQIVRDLGGRPLILREKDRLLYHISAIIACTFAASNIETAVRILQSLGVNEKRALEAVLPIAGESIHNLRELGLGAITGPQTRGDTKLIARHVKELRGRFPEIAPFYDLTSEHIMKQHRARIKKRKPSR